MTRWRCPQCFHVTSESELLRSPHPFKPFESVRGCPSCGHCAERFAELCDVPLCPKRVSCGWLSRGQYRRTCRTHVPQEILGGQRAAATHEGAGPTNQGVGGTTDSPAAGEPGGPHD